MTKILYRALILMLLAVPSLGQSITTDANLHFSAARDFSFTSNPNGSWSYGYKYSLTDPFNLDPISGSTYFSGEAGWFGPIPGGTAPGFPLVVAGPGGGNDVLDMGPGPFSYSVVRWTAPSNRRWDVVGMFFGTGMTTGDVHVLRNGRLLLDSPLNGSDVVPFFRVVAPGTGGTVDFAAGPGPDGNNGADPTGFQATIAPHLYRFTSVDYPGATSTRLLSINQNGAAVGDYVDATGTTHGMRWANGVFTVLDPPGAVLSQARGINDAGTITGWFAEESGAFHGYVFENNAFTIFDVPGAAHSQALGINNRGDIVGAYDVGDLSTAFGFVLRKGHFTLFEVPGSAPGTTIPFGITDERQIVGTYSDGQGNSFGFLRAAGQYRTISLPSADSTLTTGINEGGTIVGNYFPSDATGTHGFVLSRGKATIVEFPVLMSRTRVRGISEEGVIAGFYSPDGLTLHGFVAKPED